MDKRVRKAVFALLVVIGAVFLVSLGARDAQAALCGPGDKAQVLWKGTWYPATVLQVNKNANQCFIHYDGYGSSWDEWVGADRIRVTVSSSAAPVSAPAGAINISCGDSVKSLNKTATMNFAVVCPVNCTSGSIWGTDLYTTDSAICVAAVHAGVIQGNGGPVNVTLAPGQPAYTGSFRNGVTTGAWGSYDQSFRVAR